MPSLFELPERFTKASDKAIVNKSKSKAKSPSSIKGGGGIAHRISNITANVERNLGQYRDIYQTIQLEDVLHDYITECIGNGYFSIDTETTGLDPMLDTIAGICIYTHGQKGSYIPINHISYITGDKVADQLPINFIADEFKRLLDKKPYIDMFNASFDIRVLRHNSIPDIYCTWDGYLAARLLNENEPRNTLKKLHQKYILHDKVDAFTFDELFKGIPFTKIPIQTGYLYAANDPVITTQLCDYQRQYLREDAEREDLRQLYWVMMNVEMPCVKVVADMEDNGILLDIDYQRQLSAQYNQMLQEKLDAFYDELSKYQSQIDKYKSLHLDCKLDDPINVASPTQLAILFYDILGYESVNKKSPRGTGVEILTEFKTPLANAILEYRKVEKLISTYIDKLPECVNPNDGRIHCEFNQYGADTGRMSSSNPNMQNIPSHNKDIRKMFVASPGYVLMSSDFSQQEPKCLAALCRKQGDSQMYDTFMQGKDLYSEIASKAFNKSYEDCREFNADGSKNKEGKERRTQAKSILLGVLYGRGTASIGEQLGCTTEKAQAIKDSVFRGFPAIKQFEQSSLDMARDIGYVTTVCGRKRRLPDLQLDEFEFKWVSGTSPYVDLLDFTEQGNTDVPDSIKNKYLVRLKTCKFKDKQKIVSDAYKEGIKVIDNGGKIADATRQCVNARIQGSAADLTKIAMIELNNNEELKQLGFRLLIPVHDEVIAECPEENMKECSELLAQTMSKAAERILEMPIKCDVEITRAWYGETVSGEEIKQKETNTSHGMDVDKLREVQNGNQ